MPVDTYLVAIKWINAQHKVVSEVRAHLNTRSLVADGVLRDVSSDHIYRDEAGVINKGDLPKYFVAEATYEWQHAARKWYESLPESADFILIHQAEYDGGTWD